MLQIKIKNKLKTIFNPVYLKIDSSNHVHNVIKSFKYHLNIIIVSDNFINQDFITRHRSIYNALTNELINDIHALSLHTYTIKEWKKL
ncbi:BolA/IbaG family iron-sulfur metabolism protein [Enterobacteriaceae endosymbiont of Plateumaris pusilla]|uniref:BolA/IbaG family iron-sulfur metabolism protein n=1 Tax=Enterobacteriaceae endosymbiont of Plateumaris pusilla TaxID=2675795 RepID=UPI00144A125E|nr:BolA/IbaG family iron-sulfur metabolism protein [Enterobacteriaceae endosymbiont of Plateumaris pusilla]QJC29517.1 BolA/IbaG family iron-sulfur metabolism protein [Enterobacteriaceae endosymbiont of Plateumaris pusilla]